MMTSRANVTYNWAVNLLGTNWRRITFALTIILTILVVGFHYATLTTMPIMFIDESWNTSASWNWLQTGNNFDRIYTGSLDQFGYEWIRRPIIGQLPWVLSFSLLGVGFFQARIVSWVFGILLLISTFWVGRRLYGNMTGAVAALLLSLSLPFLQASRYARQDMMLAAIIMTAFALILIALQDDKLWVHFLAGLLLGITADVHPNGLMFIPGTAALYLVQYKWRMFHQRGTWLIALGGLIGIGYYVVFHVLPNPEIFERLFSFDTSIARAVGTPMFDFSLRGILAGIRAEISRYHFYDNNFDFAVIGASFMYLIVRRSWRDIQLVLFVLITLICFTIFVFHKDNLYAILFYSFFLLMVAETLVSLITNVSSDKSLRVFTSVLLILGIFSSIEHIRRQYQENRDYSYESITTQIRSAIPEDARVMGMPHWWLGMTEYDYRSNINIIYYNYFNNYSFLEGLEAVHPDYVIIDRLQREWMVDVDEIALGYPGFPKAKFMGFLDDHAEMVLTFDDQWHGPIEIYRIEWDDIGLE